MMNSKENKERYRHFCLENTSLPIFSKDWWLDAVCDESWNVCLIENAGVVLASMPYHLYRNRLGMTIIAQPPETQTLGPWLRPSDAKIANRLGQEKDLLTELIDQLPAFSHFEQSWIHTNTNWLPFYWRGFKQTTRYSYRLPDLSNLDTIWSGFRENIRKEIRKAKDRFSLKVRTDLSIDDFLVLNEKTYERQGQPLPYSKSFIRRLDEACKTKCSRAIFIAVDAVGRHHAGVYIVWDQQSAYYLMGGGDPELRASGAASYCMWEAIQFAATKTKSFDFEGSMIESVERFFRAFGAIQTPYFLISKTPSRLLRARQALRTVFAQ